MFHRFQTGIELALRPDQILHPPGHLVGAEERLDRLRGVALRVDRDGHDLHPARPRAQLPEGVVEVADDERADVGAVVVDERQQHRLAAELREPDAPAQRVAQREVRRGPRRRGLRGRVERRRGLGGGLEAVDCAPEELPQPDAPAASVAIVIATAPFRHRIVMPPRTFDLVGSFHSRRDRAPARPVVGPSRSAGGTAEPGGRTPRTPGRRTRPGAPAVRGPAPRSWPQSMRSVSSGGQAHQTSLRAARPGACANTPGARAIAARVGRHGSVASARAAWRAPVQHGERLCAQRSAGGARPRAARARAPSCRCRRSSPTGSRVPGPCRDAPGRCGRTNRRATAGQSADGCPPAPAQRA